MAKETADKKYTLAGTTRHNGVRTYRFATGKLNVRANMLRHKEHTAIKLFELPREMNKKQAIAWLINEKGVKAYLPTRSANKKKKSPILLAGIALAEKGQKIKASKATKKKAATPAAVAAPATEPAPA